MAAISTPIVAAASDEAAMEAMTLARALAAWRRTPGYTMMLKAIVSNVVDVQKAISALVTPA